MSEGSIIRRGKTSWRIKFELPPDQDTGQRRTRYITVKGTKADAQRRLRKELQAIDDGTYVEQSGKLTVGDYLDDWLKIHRQTVSAITAQRYDDHIEHIRSDIGGIELRKLTSMRLSTLYADKLKSGRKDGKGGLSPRSIWHIDRMLHKAFEDAIDQTPPLLAVNPTRKAKRPRLEKKPPKTTTPDGLRRLLLATDDPRMRAAIFTIWTTGLRRGELLALRDRDVDLDSGNLSVVQAISDTKAEGVTVKEPKTATSVRRIELAAETVELLRRHRLWLKEQRLALGLAWSPDVLLFGTIDGEIQRPRNFTKAVVRIAKRAGLDGVTPHVGRHSHLSQLMSLNVHPKIAQLRAGHSSVAVTMDIYSHASEAMQRAAVDALDGELKKWPSKTLRYLPVPIRCQLPLSAPMRIC